MTTSRCSGTDPLPGRRECQKELILADATAPETAVFAWSEGIARGETLFDTGAERSDG